MPYGVALVHIGRDENLVPIDFMEAIAFLERSGIKHSVHIPSRCAQTDWGKALAATLQGIGEDVVYISFLNENHYLALASLLSLALCRSWLQGKKVHVCLPALSLFTRRPAFGGRFFLHAECLTHVLRAHAGVDFYLSKAAPQALASVMIRYGYQGRIVSGVLSPGCPHRCSFCFSRDSGEKFARGARQRKERILALLEVARLTGASCFKFRDPDFLAHGVAARAMLKTLRGMPQRLPWRCSLRLDRLDKKTFEGLVQSGCVQVFAGVEHVVRRLVRQSRKKEDVLRLLSSVLRDRPEQITLALSFLTGLPGESVGEAGANLNFIDRVRKIKGVKPYLGYYVLLQEQARPAVYDDPMLALIHFSHIVPEKKVLAYKDYTALGKHVATDHFFGFCSQTANRNSRDILRLLLGAFAAKPGLANCMPVVKAFLRDRYDLAAMIMRV